jgi:hypothetical protein
MYRRRHGVIYWQENDSKKQGILRTTDRREAERLLNAMNESHRQPTAWAQRAKACGYPQRFAQEALGHNSRAVHEAYAKAALVILPALEEYEQMQTIKVIPLALNQGKSRVC